MNIIKKIRRNIQDYGISAAAKKSAAALFGGIFSKRTYRIYRKDLSPFEPAGDVPSGLIIRFADESDVQILRQVENIAEWLKGSMEEKIRSGDLCLVALSGDVVEGFNIAAFGTVYIPLIRRERRFRGSEAWSEHIAVQPDFRKRGLAAHLRYRMFEELASRGIKRFYGGTLSTNIPALKLAQKVGFKTLADIVYISVLGRKCWRFKRAIS